MKIFSAAQVRQWDAYTISQEPVDSIGLIERAATACCDWLLKKFEGPNTYTIFCGTGNNGGDGLAIARLLLQAGNTVSVFILEGGKRSGDFTANLEKLSLLQANIQFINPTDFHVIPTGTIVIDALLGSGLSRPLEGLAADLVNYINLACKTIISIDLPTGFFTDASSNGNVIISANHTLSFQCPKLASFMAGNNKYTGNIHLLDIGLHRDFYNAAPTLFNTIDQTEISKVYKKREQFLHKYDFGHALLYAGSKNMTGAAILCAKACMRSGSGLVSVYSAEGTPPLLQVAFPEAITTTEKDLSIVSKKKSAIGIGPGLEISAENRALLDKLLVEYSGPLVIDASALQLLAEDTTILQKHPAGQCVLTPHTGEFEKLFGKTSNDFETVDLAIQKSAETGCYIILKGHHTLIACPDGTAYFNTTGNAGMATAGSGDVLTGMLTGLLAQKYSLKDACLLGVYLHGLAGDCAAEKMSQEAMIAGDIIDCIGDGYKITGGLV